MDKNKRVLITGASGFLGQFCAQTLQSNGLYKIRLATRSVANINHLKNTFEVAQIEDISSNPSWKNALQACDCIIHTAGHAHRTKKNDQLNLNEFRRINVDGTVQLARQAILAGVKRFIYISSIKVNGEKSLKGIPFRADDSPDPKDPYSLSKLEAEIALKKLSEQSGMELVIIRPPLIYGPGVKGNFKIMLQWLQKGYPIPIMQIENKRSFVGLRNLIDFIEVCIEHPQAVNQLFLISDGDDLSTIELLNLLGTMLQKHIRLLHLPPKGLSALLKLMGKKSVLDKLYGSLQVNIEKNSRVLAWTPKYKVKDMLQETVDDYLQNVIV